MTWRFISAGIIVSFVMAVIALDYWLGRAESVGYPGIALIPVILVMTGMAAFELATMIASRNPSTPKSMVVLGAVVTMACACAPALWREYPANCAVGKLGWNTIGMTLAAAIAILFEMSRYKEAEKVIANLAYSVFMIFYVGFLMGFLSGLRFYQSNEVGMTALLSMLFVVKFADAGALFVGKLIGRHKLAPKMSPGKSIEGAVGAIVTGCLVSWLFFTYAAPWISNGQIRPGLLPMLIYGLVIALTGLIGDLFESIIKRDFDAKDSSKWLPGLGGMLDIFDSILAAAPAAYVLWVIGLLN